MPRYSPDKEDIYEPIRVKLEHGGVDEIKKILKCIDIKIAEITNIISDKDKLNQLKLDGNTITNLRVISDNIKNLAQLVDNPEYKICDRNHFIDRLGQVPNALQCLNNTSVKVIESGAKAIEEFKRYTDLCLKDDEFLKLALETVEGPKIH